MRYLLPFVIILLAVPLAHAHVSENGQSDLTNPIQPTEASISAGKALFAQRCAACHGTNGEGLLKGMPNLRDHEMMSEMTEGDIFMKITEGVPGTAMPSWEDELGDDERWNLVNYINTLHHEEKPAAAPSKGICGPTALMLLGIVPLLFSRRKLSG